MPGRVARAWRGLPPERRLAAGAALGLFVTLFLPWYQETVIAERRDAGAAVGERVADRLGRVLVRRGGGAAGRRRRAGAAVHPRRGQGLPRPRRRRRRDHRGRRLDRGPDRLADVRQGGDHRPRPVRDHVRDRVGHLRRARRGRRCWPTRARGSGSPTSPSRRCPGRRRAAPATRPTPSSRRADRAARPRPRPERRQRGARRRTPGRDPPAPRRAWPRESPTAAA